MATTKTAIFTTTYFEGVPTYISSNITEWATKVRNTANNSLRGKMNSVGTFTLGANTASTMVVTTPGLITPNSVIAYYPKTANAAANFADGAMFLSTVDPANDRFTLTHTNDANTDKTFQFAVLG